MTTNLTDGELRTPMDALRRVGSHLPDDDADFSCVAGDLDPVLASSGIPCAGKVERLPVVTL